jgi:hypothetical protein
MHFSKCLYICSIGGLWSDRRTGRCWTRRWARCGGCTRGLELEHDETPCTLIYHLLMLLPSCMYSLCIQLLACVDFQWVVGFGQTMCRNLLYACCRGGFINLKPRLEALCFKKNPCPSMMPMKLIDLPASHACMHPRSYAWVLGLPLSQGQRTVAFRGKAVAFVPTSACPSKWANASLHKYIHHPKFGQ